MITEIPEGWAEYQIGDLIKDISDGGTPPRNNESYFEGDIPWVVIEDIEFNIFDTKEHLAEEGLKKCSSKLWPVNSVILSTGASIGEVGLAKVPLATKQGITGMIVKEELVNPEYLARWFQANKATLQRYAQGSSIKEIRAPILCKRKIILPPREIQDKIVDIINSNAGAVEETDKIIKESERIKKGLMQKLLSKNPNKLRECKLKDVVQKFRSGGTPRTKEKNYWNGNISWITGADFLDGKLGKIRRHITSEAVKNSATNVIKKGDLLLVTRTGVGKMAIAPFNVAISQDITGVIFKKDIIPEYGYWFLKANISKIQTLNQGTSINGIIRNDLENSIIVVPSHDEQLKIIDIMNNVDQRIEDEHLKINKLLKIKKGLMQKLLTCQIRVKVD